MLNKIKYKTLKFLNCAYLFPYTESGYKQFCCPCQKSATVNTNRVQHHTGEIYQIALEMA